MMKSAIATSILRVKILCYALLFNLQSLVVRAARALPGCWTVLGIPRYEIDDVEKWVKKNPGEGKTLGPYACAPPRYVSFGSLSHVPRRNTPPPGLDGVHPELRQENLEFHQPFLALLPCARLLGPHGAVITPDGGILTQSTWSRGLFQRDRIYRSLRLPTPERLEGSYYTIASAYSANYYHWVVETLARLFAYESIVGDRPRLIVNSSLKNWQLESLKLIGFGEEDMLPLDNGYLHLEKLYFPSDVGINPYTLQWLRRTLIRPIPDQPPTKRIYITRRSAARRRLLNEDEIEPVLQQHGFITAEMETLSFAEQVLLFSQADLIVSIHGAGLTNMVYAPEGCGVMEIVDPSHVGAMYYMLAETLKHRYFSCVGQSVGDDSFRHGGAHGHDDVTVSVDSFSDTLSRMLESKAGS